MMRNTDLTIRYEDFSETFAGFCFVVFGKQYIVVNNTLNSHEQELYKLALKYFLKKGLAPKKISLPPSTAEELRAIEYATTLLAEQVV